ncbi:hypothetical protein GCK72_015366 [Caenorhabditis remanei]|uniref:CUB-like domain-containing protein n=1 Tax=Caenorhabditis remanei TaxID=31234 RepID=A0A6A5GWB3_CAERE|nr:hypothetical protein GCK72_015366 [Caenorhabditis remanei]KAF1758906.1 hypothetical protein GCK72_015366 [Caenorhabditis remanei]
MFFRLFLFLSVASVSLAAGNVCKTGNIVNRLVNSQPYYWPATWNETQTAPALEMGQTCSWTVTIPQGYYAKLIINGQTQDSTSIFQTIDAAGNLMRTSQEGMQPYYFPPSKFSVTVSNQAAATFAFRIEWKLLPTNPTLYTQISAIAEVINATNKEYYIVYDSNSGVSLLPFPEDINNYYSLRSTLIFDGGSIQRGGNYVGNLFLIYQSGNQYITSNGFDSVVIVNLEASNNTDRLLIQESIYVKNLHYVELVPVPNSQYKATLNSQARTSALVSTLYIKQTLIDIQMDDNANITVAYGTPDPMVYDKTYTGLDFKKLLPIMYETPVLTFVLDSGVAVFTFQA